MDGTTWKRAKQVFHEALEKSGPERSGFVASACGEDRELCAQVQALLNAHDEAGEFLASPTVPEASEAALAATTLSSSPPTERPGATIGPYKLLQVIGEGGFGVVYMADQEEPVRRRVALKIIKLGMDTKQVIARFEAERQALALMEHLNIARVLDAGATETGRPYFVMELVKGVPITEYCDSNRLAAHERLDLFLEVCAAVQHAHQKGIIHRDIKPSNVLVTLHDGKPVPKVIDFGIAKATHQRLTEKTLFTQYGQFIGTPAYMSPEQAEMSGLDVDTRSDIYSLGVLLYELLTGTTPFDVEALRRVGYGELQRLIREEEPPKPSTRLSTLGGALTDVARQRKIDPRGLSRLLRGELDWIVMRALEKERSRRYSSSGDLADDIRRHLIHEPVLAGPPSVVYRARKFVRRHRVGVFAAALVFVALVAGLGAATYGLIEARRANERTRQEAMTAEQVSEFLVGLFDVADPQVARGDTVTAREILDRGVERIERELSGQPEVRARLKHTMGRVYTYLGRYDHANPLLEEALADRREILGPEHPATLETAYKVAWLYRVQARRDEAARLSAETLDARRRVLGDEHPATLRSMRQLGNIYRLQRRYDEAEPLLTDALEAQRRILGAEHWNTRDTIYDLTLFFRDTNQYDRAETVGLEELEFERQHLGDDHPFTLDSQRTLARLYIRMERYDEAERVLLPTLALHERVFGLNHPSTRGAVNLVASAYKKQRRHEEAEELLRGALDRRRRLLGEEHAGTLWSMNKLAFLYKTMGRYDEAEGLYGVVLEKRRATLGDDHPSTLQIMSDLGWMYNQLGRANEAEPLHREALETRRRVLGEDAPQTLSSKHNLAWARELQGRLDEAERLFRENLEARRRVLGEDHENTMWARYRLAGVYAQQGRDDEAVQLYLENASTEHKEASRSLYNLGCIEAMRGNRRKAMDWLHRSVDAGYINADWMAKDPDLESLHGPEFDSLVERARKSAPGPRASAGSN